MHLKISSAKRPPFCSGINVFIVQSFITCEAASAVLQMVFQLIGTWTNSANVCEYLF